MPSSPSRSVAVRRRPFVAVSGVLSLVGGLAAGAGALVATPAAHAHASWAADDVDAVNGALRRAESNLNSVNGSIGRRTTPPRGSAAKLAASRLEQARGDIERAGAILKKLPANGPGVADAVKRHGAAVALHTKLVGILTGGKPTPAKPDAPDAVKLNYQQVDLLKAARFNLNEVDSNSRALTTLMGELVSVDDQLAIDYRRVAAGLATVANGRRKAGFVADALDQLPPNGAGVPAVAAELAAAREAIEGAAAYLTPLSEKLGAIVNPASWPEADADVRRLQALSQMYRDPGAFETNMPLAAEALEQADAAREECIRIARTYQRLLQQQTDLGTRIESVGNNFLQSHAAFLAAAEAQRTILPAKIREHLAEAAGYADEAVAEQKPAWFGGGIPQQMDFADAKIDLLRRIDADAARTMAAERDALQARIKKQANSLRDLIIRENRLPGDRYAGNDRAAVIAVAIDAWMVQQPTFELLAVRMPIDTWTRERKMTWSSGSWVYSDRSRLQLRLLVADPKNPEHMLDRPITVIRDHERGDTMIGTPLWSIKDELPPRSVLRRGLATPGMRTAAKQAYEAAVKVRASRG